MDSTAAGGKLARDHLLTFTCMSKHCNMEKRLCLLEETVARQAILIQQLQFQLEGQAVSQQKAQVSQPKGARPKAGDGVAVTSRCEYGENCGKQFCRFEHACSYCNGCKKHTLLWGRVNFCTISEAAKTTHFKAHNINNKDTRYIDDFNEKAFDTCWQGYFCTKCTHLGDRIYRKFKMTCGGNCCPTAVKWAKEEEEVESRKKEAERRKQIWGDDSDDDHY